MDLVTGVLVSFIVILISYILLLKKRLSSVKKTEKDTKTQAELAPSNKAETGPVVEKVWWREFVARNGDFWSARRLLVGKHGKTIKVWHPNDTWTIYTADPAVIKIIFSDNNTWYKSAGGVPAQMLVGQGLTSVNGEHWKRQRNFITRLFQPSKVNLHRPVIEAIAEKYFQNFETTNESQISGGKFIDLAEFFRTISLEINITCTIGNFENSENFGELFQEVWNWWRTPNREQNTKMPPISELKKSVIEVVSRRQKEIQKGKISAEEEFSFLTCMLRDSADSLTNGYMSFDEIVDNIVSFLLAGYETLAHTFTFCVYLAQYNRKFEAELEQEISEAGKSDLLLTTENLDKLGKLELLIKETLRLYHPVGGASRYPQKPVTIQNFEIPEFHRVITDTIPGHRDPEIWGKDPDTFNPWRFETPMTPAQKEAYMPWGGGQRYCVGRRYACHLATLPCYN